MKLKELFSVLVLYRSNFENLHWNATGENFDNGHKEISTDYYEMISGTIDTVAEMLARLGVNPPNYKEVMEDIEEMDDDFLLVESKELYNRTAIVGYADVMLNDIVKLLIKAWDSDEMKDPINVGIKSTLESLINDYDIQARYINKRKLCKECD